MSLTCLFSDSYLRTISCISSSTFIVMAWGELLNGLATESSSEVMHGRTGKRSGESSLAKLALPKEGLLMDQLPNTKKGKERRRRRRKGERLQTYGFLFCCSWTNSTSSFPCRRILLFASFTSSLRFFRALATSRACLS